MKRVSSIPQLFLGGPNTWCDTKAEASLEAEKENRNDTDAALQREITKWDGEHDKISRYRVMQRMNVK